MRDRQNSEDEPTSRMEPLFLDEPTLALADTAAAISKAVVQLGGGLPPASLASLADLTRIINCYYSNLIEGHKTRPRDIDTALQAVRQKRKRKNIDDKGESLLRLAICHIECQQWIDQLYAAGTLPNPASVDFICDIHKRFYEKLPVEFREIRHHKTTELKRVMVAGQMRRSGEEVDVGLHLPPTGGDAVNSFLREFERRYSILRSKGFGTAQRLFAIAAAHHRFLFIHPFDDGNGRVARLVTHAMMLDAGLGASGLWSMSRGMARGLRHDAPHTPKVLAMFEGVEPVAQYKLMMSHTDGQRRNDLDGRGNLSRERLQDFTDWFLAVALDQLVFMNKHFNLTNIADGLTKHYVPRRRLDPRAAKVLAELSRLGTLDRGTVRGILKVSVRTATTIVSELLKDGIVQSDSPKGPLRLHFSPESAEILFPALFGVEVSTSGADDA